MLYFVIGQPGRFTECRDAVTAENHPAGTEADRIVGDDTL
jgi:hypothetical protein